MMIILSDTSEEEDVHINDWLVNERLAQIGKTVRMCNMINYLRIDEDNTIESYTSVRIFYTEKTFDVNKSRNQSISHNERTHRLSDVKSEDIENKTVKSLHNVPASKKALLQMLWSKSPDAKSLHAKSPSAKSPDAKSLDAKSQSRNYPQNGESRIPRELVPLLERLKTSSLNRKSNSNPSTSTCEAYTDNKDNARQIDSSRKIESDSSRDDCYGFMNFSIRDSDEENDTKDFGTFRSLYGGHGLMEPFDWSVIREENNNFRHKKIDMSSDNLDTSINENKSDVEDSESKSRNQRNDIPGKQYFLNMTCMEKENFLPENNIDYDVKNISNCIKMLRDKTEPNHTVTVMFAPSNKLKTLRDSDQFEDTSNSNTNIVKLNDIASSKEMDQEVNKNGKVYKTRADQKKMKNGDTNTDSESAFSNISSNECKINGERSESNNSNNSFESNTSNKAYNPRYKMLLEKMKRRQMDSINDSFVNTNESSSSEQISSSSYSCNNSSDDTISSNNEQPDTNTCIKIHDLVKESASTSEELPKYLTLDESRLNSDSEGIRVISTLETSSIASSNVDGTKQLQLNQFLDTDPIVSSVDNTKQHQLSQSFDSITSACNVDDLKCQLNRKILGIPKIKQQMLKIVQNIVSNTELDSDDWSSSQESVKNDKSDESKGDIKSNCISETCESMNDDANVTEIAFVPPIYNDCDVESDESEWDAYAGSREDIPFYIAQSPE